MSRRCLRLRYLFFHAQFRLGLKDFQFKEKRVRYPLESQGQYAKDDKKAVRPGRGAAEADRPLPFSEPGVKAVSLHSGARPRNLKTQKCPTKKVSPSCCPPSPCVDGFDCHLRSEEDYYEKIGRGSSQKAPQELEGGVNRCWTHTRTLGRPAPSYWNRAHGHG